LSSDVSFASFGGLGDAMERSSHGDWPEGSPPTARWPARFARLWPAGALIALAFAVWRDALHGGLWADDTPFVLFARHAPLDQLLDVWRLKLEHARDYWIQYASLTQISSPVRGLQAYWRPATNLITALDVRLWGDRIWGLHLTNILAHAACAVAFRRVLARLGFSPRLALAAAALWLIFPAHLAPVAWISARHDLFAALFTLLAFDAYLRWREENRPVRLALFGAFWFVLAMLSKAVALPFPAIVLVHAMLFPDRKPEFIRRLTTHWLVPIGALGVGLTLLMIHWPAPEGFYRLPSSLLNFLFERDILVTLSLPVQYLLETFTGVPPMDLDFMPWPLFTGPLLFAAWAAVLACIYAFRRNRLFLLGAAWFALWMLPILPIRAGSHYVYLATFGFALALVAAIVPVLASARDLKPKVLIAMLLLFAAGWISIVQVGLAGYRLIPHNTQLFLSDLKRQLPNLETADGSRVRRLYVLNGWSGIHHLGYLIRETYGDMDLEARILTVDPSPWPKELDTDFDPFWTHFAAYLRNDYSETTLYYRQIDAHTLEMGVKGSAFLQTVLEKYALLLERSLRAKKTYRLDGGLEALYGFTARIVATDWAGRPTRFRFEFAHRLDDPGVRFILQRGARAAPLYFNAAPQKPISREMDESVSCETETPLP